MSVAYCEMRISERELEYVLLVCKKMTTEELKD